MRVEQANYCTRQISKQGISWGQETGLSKELRERILHRHIPVWAPARTHPSPPNNFLDRDLEDIFTCWRTKYKGSAARPSVLSFIWQTFVMVLVGAGIENWICTTIAWGCLQRVQETGQLETGHPMQPGWWKKGEYIFWLSLLHGSQSWRTEMSSSLVPKLGTWVSSWKPPSLPTSGEPTSQSPWTLPLLPLCDLRPQFLHFLPRLGWWPPVLSPFTDHACLQAFLHDAGGNDLCKIHAWPWYFLPQVPLWLLLPSELLWGQACANVYIAFHFP